MTTRTHIEVHPLKETLDDYKKSRGVKTVDASYSHLDSIQAITSFEFEPGATVHADHNDLTYVEYINSPNINELNISHNPLIYLESIKIGGELNASNTPIHITTIQRVAADALILNSCMVDSIPPNIQFHVNILSLDNVPFPAKNINTLIHLFPHINQLIFYSSIEEFKTCPRQRIIEDTFNSIAKDDELTLKQKETRFLRATAKFWYNK